MADHKPVRVTDPDVPQLTIVGVGGTGGFVAADVCQLLWGLKQERLAAHAAPRLRGFGPLPPGTPERSWCGTVPDVLLIDGDSIERPNVVRQAFVPADVGRPKALVLAERMGAFALAVSAYPRYLGTQTDLKDLVPERSVVVGCVDNAATRRLLHEQLLRYRDVVYVDSGNGAMDPTGPQPTREDLACQRETGWSGQVVCGVRKDGQTIIPFPGEAMPDLLVGDGAEDMVPDEVPCHVAVQGQPQRFLTNRRAATTIVEYLGPLLTDGHLLHARTFFDARRLYAKSYPAIDELHEVAA